MPAWAFSLAPKWLGQARALVRTARGAADPRPQPHHRHARGGRAVGARGRGRPAAAQHRRLRGRQRARHLQPRRLAGHHRRARTDRGSGRGRAALAPVGRLGRVGRDRFSATALPAALTARDYVRDFRAYAARPGRRWPRGSCWPGPALANPIHHGRWVPTLIDDAHRDLGMVTIHRYPYTGCPRRRGTRVLRHHRPRAQPGGLDGHGRRTAAARRRRPRRRPAAAPHRAQLRQLRGLGRRQRRLRHRAVGARRVVLAAARRRRRRQPARPRRTPSTPRSPSGRAASRPGRCSTDSSCSPAPSARDAQLVTAALASQPARERRGVGGPRRARHPPRPAHRQEPPLRARIAAATGDRRAPACSDCSPRRRPRGRASPSAAARWAPTGAGRAWSRARRWRRGAAPTR